jgi:hypothetical protein
MFTIRALKSRKAVWNPIAERPFLGPVSSPIAPHCNVDS